MMQNLMLSIVLTSFAMIFTSNMTRAAEKLQQQVPFFDDGVMVRVPVNAFGKTLYFSLDSGFTVSAIDAGYKQYLGEQVTTYFAGSPLGTDKTLPAFHCPDMSISGKSLNFDKIICLDLQMLRFISGQQCDGILGMDFFATNIVSINFDKNVLTLNYAVPDNVKNTFVAIPLKQSAQCYTLDVLVNQDKRLTLMVDTGDNSSISLNSEAWQEVFGNDDTNVIVTTVADAANQVAQSKIGVIRRLAIGNLNYTNLHATFILNPTNPSHIGLGFFRRHNVTFDFENRRIYLEPGQTFSTPDKEDMSGLHLIRQREMTIVYSIDKNSPAYDQGIKAKDIVVLVNGQNTSSMTMRAIRRVLKFNDGDKITMQVRRGENVLNFAFALKRAI